MIFGSGDVPPDDHESDAARSVSRSSGRTGFDRLLPPGLAGPGRRPAWQRTRLRRVVSAVLFATAAWLALSAFLPHPPPRGVPIVVVARDLLPGHVLTSGDLAVADWPSDLTPAGSFANPGRIVGKALGAGMARGEPMTAARIRGSGLLAGAGAGLVAAHARLCDPAMATMASPGDHVDLISASGQVAATDVVVLAVDAGPDGNSGWAPSSSSAPPGGVVVAVANSEAIKLATSDPTGSSEAAFSLVMRAPAL